MANSVSKTCGAYASFFKDCVDFAQRPYKSAYNEYVINSNDKKMGWFIIAALSFLPPILPIATAIAFSIALVGAIIAAVSFPFGLGFSYMEDMLPNNCCA